MISKVVIFLNSFYDSISRITFDSFTGCFDDFNYRIQVFLVTTKLHIYLATKKLAILTAGLWYTNKNKLTWPVVDCCNSVDDVSSGDRPWRGEMITSRDVLVGNSTGKMAYSISSWTWMTVQAGCWPDTYISLYETDNYQPWKHKWEQ